MKLNKFKYATLVFGLFMMISACSDDDSDDPIAPTSTPKPEATISVNGAVDKATYDVLKDSPVKISYTARSAAGGGRDLDKISLTQNGINATTNFKVTSSNGNDYDFSTSTPQNIPNSDDNNLSFTETVVNITSKVGVTTYTFTVTDKDGLQTVTTFDINVVTATPFNLNKAGAIWHIEGQQRGSWSLTGDSSISAVSGNPEMYADIMNTDAVSTTFTGSFEVGSSRANTDFVKAPAAFDYANASREVAQAAYDTLNQITETVTAPAVGDVYIFNLGNGGLALVSITAIDPNAACGPACANPGRMDFEYRK